MKVSLRHIAEEVGVSISTASRALAGSATVNEQTRQRVLDAAHTLGYTGGRASRQSEALRSVGLLMPEQAHAMGFNTRTWLAQIEGISEVSRPLGCSLVIGTYRPDEDSLSHQRIDGALLTRTSSTVVAVNDRIAVGAIKAAKEAGLQIPRDLSVVGFDDTVSASYADPP